MKADAINLIKQENISYVSDLGMYVLLLYVKIQYLHKY